MALIDFVNMQYDAVMEGLEGKNLDVYLQVFGIRIYRVIVEHLKKSRVSVTGAFLLTRYVSFSAPISFLLHSSSPFLLPLLLLFYLFALSFL